MAIKFIRYLYRHTFERQLVFDIKLGKIFRRTLKEADRKRADRFWKIKDPFIKEFVYGGEFQIRDQQWTADSNPKQRLNLLLAEMKNLVEAIQIGKGSTWLYPAADAVILLPQWEA